MKTLHLSIFTMTGICLFMLGLMPILPAQATQYTFSSSFGMLGHGAGQFSYPTEIAINNTGFVYVADSSNVRIQIFDSAGHWKKSFGTVGNATGQFDYIEGIAINSTDSIFVTDQYNHRIQIFDPSGNWKQTIGGDGGPHLDSSPLYSGSGSANGQFSFPYGITLNSTGSIFVVDTGNNRVQIFNAVHIVPEFPFVVPILLISFVSVIIFYRIRFIK